MAPLVLVGNKCDLVESRKVTREEINDLVKKYKLIYFEGSATSSINVKEAFEEICTMVYAYCKALQEPRFII